MTRHPKSGKGRKWTQLELKAIPATWSGDTLGDGDGLSGQVRVAGNGAISVRFQSAFKWNGKVNWHQCGTWPTLSMEQIRANRDHARELVRSGINPNDHKKAERIELQAKVKATIAKSEEQATNNLTFLAMYEAWLKDGVVRNDGNAEIRRSFKKDVLPAIGNRLVSEINEHHLRAVLRAVVGRGVNRMAVRIYHDLVQMFTWSEKRKPWRELMVEGNPTDLLEIAKIVAPDYDLSGQRDRVLTHSELRELNDIFEDMERTYKQAPVGTKYDVARALKKETQIAVWICLSTLCRIGELLMSKWEHIDFTKGEWTIPLENVKGARGKKQTQLVSLSNFSLGKFKELHEITGQTPYCFPSRNTDVHVCVKSVSKQIGDRQTKFKSRSKPLKKRRNDDSLVLNSGKSGEWTPHDMRRTGATMMQAAGVLPVVIDHCQNHVMAGSKVRRAYLHHEYQVEKREAWERLGKRLEVIFEAP